MILGQRPDSLHPGAVAEFQGESESKATKRQARTLRARLNVGYWASDSMLGEGGGEEYYGEQALVFRL